MATMVAQASDDVIPIITEVSRAFQGRDELALLKEHQRIKSMIAGAYAEKEAEMDVMVAGLQKI